MFQPSKELTITTVAHPCLPKWRARIDEAERRGGFDQSDKLAAANWNRCGMHEAATRYSVAMIKRGGYSVPVDDDLLNLGICFTGPIYRGSTEFAEARRILTAIEARLSEIL